ncbi:MAG TPA: hypothetical protein DHV62_08835, partial [Elusimicrobia bacterium]|nr:hypothetical protein [Elusimicrobiota bacterium]
MKKLLFFVLIFSLIVIHNLSFVVNTCFASGLEGSFTRVIGQIKIRKANSSEWTNAEENMPVSLSDQIRSGAKSEAEITFDEGTIIRLEPESFVSISESTFEEKTQLKKLIIKANNGRVATNLEKFVHPKSKFEIQGPGGVVAAVRGTEFVFDISQDETVELAVFGGAVSVRNEKVAPEKEFLIPQEKETVVKPGKEPLAPRNLTEKFLKYREEKIKAFHERVAENRKRRDEIRQRRMLWLEQRKIQRKERMENR